MAKAKFIGFHAPPEMHERIRQLAEREDRSMSAVLRRLVDMQLDNRSTSLGAVEKESLSRMRTIVAGKETETGSYDDVPGGRGPE